MIEISHTFRAGWEACEKAFQRDGVPYSVSEQALHDAWKAYCGTSPAPPPQFTPEAFVDDWNAMIATVSETCARHNMRKPDMVFHPEWLQTMRTYAQANISSTLVHMGVRVKFATFEQATVIREI